MSTNNHKIDEIITKLYRWCTTFKDQALFRDTTKLRNTMFDAYIDSNLTTALSFTIFELSDKGELIIDKQQRVLESHRVDFCSKKYAWKPEKTVNKPAHTKF